MHRQVIALVLAGMPLSAFAQAIDSTAPAETAELTPQALLNLAVAALARGDTALAEAAFRALSGNRDTEIRSEARFRLAMLQVGAGRLSAAATLLRAILDEKPEAQRVRLELARVLELMGDEGGALRLLRAVQAGGLPPEVAQFVDRYSAALRSRKPLGATLELALAPDSNVNRATRSETLATVLGDFSLDSEARARSGVGLALRGQVFGRHRHSETVNLVGRISGLADLYREGGFNDVAAAVSGGPELRFGSDRLTLEAGRVWRWYGQMPYSSNWTFSATYTRQLDRQSQLRGAATLGLVNNHRNDLLDGTSYAVSASYERALSARTGVGVTVAIERQALRDPAYAMTGGQLSLFGYQEVGAVTLVATATHGRLLADDRLALLPERRSDALYRLSLGATFRRFQIGGFAPMLRLTAERNRSTSEIYDFRKIRTEIGVTRVF